MSILAAKKAISTVSAGFSRMAASEGGAAPSITDARLRRIRKLTDKTSEFTEQYKEYIKQRKKFIELKNESAGQPKQEDALTRQYEKFIEQGKKFIKLKYELSYQENEIIEWKEQLIEQHQKFIETIDKQMNKREKN